MVNELEQDTRIFPIAWHVDYWDYLGWTDPFAAEAYSDRQYHYANVIDATSVYTPDFWVNGTQVPSWAIFNATEIQSLVDEQLQLQSHAQVGLTLASEADASPLLVDYDVTGAPAGTDVFIVLVERGLEQVVVAGENNGLTLDHENVVRAFVSVDPGSGQASLTVPDEVVRENCSVMAFVQNWSTLCMYGANAITLVP